MRKVLERDAAAEAERREKEALEDAARKKKEEEERAAQEQKDQRLAEKRKEYEAAARRQAIREALRRKFVQSHLNGDLSSGLPRAFEVQQSFDHLRSVTRTLFSNAAAGGSLADALKKGLTTARPAQPAPSAQPPPSIQSYPYLPKGPPPKGGPRPAAPKSGAPKAGAPKAGAPKAGEPKAGLPVRPQAAEGSAPQQQQGSESTGALLGQSWYSDASASSTKEARLAGHDAVVQHAAQKLAEASVDGSLNLNVEAALAGEMIPTEAAIVTNYHPPQAMPAA